MDSTLLDVFIFLAAACLIVPLASRFKLGAVLGYLLAGVLIGPFALGFISEAEKIMHFAEFGVVMMLFLIGLELEPAILWRLRKSILGLGGLQMLLSIVAFSAIGLNLGLSWNVSLAAGMALSLSSTALVLQVLQEKNLLKTVMGESAFSVLLFQDISVIVILIIFPLIAIDAPTVALTNNSLIAHLSGGVQGLIIVATILLLILSGRYISHHLFRTIARTNLREIFTALSLGLIVGTTLLMHMIGVSPALGAFIAGVVLANSEYRRALEADLEPFKGLLLGLFFISVGMSIDFNLLMAEPLSISAAVATLLIVKILILLMLGRLFGITSVHNIGYALAVCQGSEFAFVLFKMGASLTLFTPEQSQFLTLTVALSMAATPLLMLWYTRVLMPRFMSILSSREFDAIEEQQPVILIGFGRFGQIIGRFLFTQDVKVTVLEKDPDQIAMIRKFGYKGYFGDATRLELLHSAGAANALVLIVAVREREISKKIIKMAKEEFPHLTIFARAHNRQHAYELFKLGVHSFKREVFDSALAMASDIMVWMGKDARDMHDKAERFRNHDEETLQNSFAFFEDEAALISFAKTRRAELEQILHDDEDL